MNTLRRILPMVLVATVGCVPPPEVAPEGDEVLVTRVFDGDTIEVRTDQGSVMVRLDGINAPDRGECYFEEATGQLREFVHDEMVLLEVTGDDQFDRVLALIWLGDLLVNRDLVATGHAIASTPLRAGMASAENAAKSGRIGLWSPESCGSGPIPEINVDFGRSVVDPPGPDDQRLQEEVVYFRNMGSSAVDLTGWVLRDESSRHRYHFSSGSRIGPGETLGVRSADPGWDPGGSPVWNNDGDIIMLLDRFGRVVAAHRY